jgi:hypothetical protein
MKMLKLTVLVLLAGGLAISQTQQLSPIQAMWAGIKTQLTGPEGQRYFRENLNDCELPILEGYLISATPADHPNVLVVGIANPQLPEVTLRLKDDKGNDAHLSGPLMRGSQVRFEGVVKAFAQDPFMLTFDVSTEFKKPAATRRKAR